MLVTPHLESSGNVLLSVLSILAAIGLAAVSTNTVLEHINRYNERENILTDLAHVTTSIQIASTASDQCAAVFQDCSGASLAYLGGSLSICRVNFDGAIVAQVGTEYGRIRIDAIDLIEANPTDRSSTSYAQVSYTGYRAQIRVRASVVSSQPLLGSLNHRFFDLKVYTDASGVFWVCVSPDSDIITNSN